MKDSNLPLRKAIADIIAPLVNMPVFYKLLPPRLNVDAYVLISSINNNDASTMQTHDTENSVQISIVSRETLVNPGDVADTTAGIILTALLPNPAATFDVPGFQNIGVNLVGDNSPDAIDDGVFIFINRFLTFRVRLLHLNAA